MNEPIFIVGMPRSGTTLLSLLLDAHSRLAITPETHYFEKFWGKCERRKCRSDERQFERFVRYFLSGSEVRAFGFSEVERDGLLDEILQGERSHRAVLGLTAARYAQMRRKARWGEKTPGHALFVDRILDTFPEASILQIVRDPRDVALSLGKVPWGWGNVVEVSRRWRRCVGLMDLEDRLTRDNYLAVRYEDVVREPEPTLAKICEFLHLPYEPAMISHTARARPNYDPDAEPWKRRSVEPIDPKNVRKWEREMPPREANLVAKIAGASMTRFGYEVGRSVRTPGAAFYGVMRRAEYILLLTRHWAKRAQRRLFSKAEPW